MLGAAAAQGLTLVIYMGMAQLAQLQHGLLSALPGDAPAAIVQDVGNAGERQLGTTLAQLAADAAQAHFGSPAIVIVGDVLRARAAVSAERRAAA